MTAITTTAPTADGQLIPTFKAAIGGASVLCCDARALHAYLGSGKQFADWFKYRCEQYGFAEGEDYVCVSQKSETQRKSGQRGVVVRKDYHITLDMAKELSMVENNERGRQARRYFIECERRALEAAGQTVEPPRHETLLPSEQQTLKEIAHRRVAALPADAQGRALAEIWSRVQNKFRVARYSQLPRVQLADAIAYVMTMDLRSLPADEPPAATREQLSSRDINAIRRVIWVISRGMHFESSWAQAMWRMLRAALGNPAPNPFYVDQLPAIARLLASVIPLAAHLHKAEQRVEQAALRHMLAKLGSAQGFDDVLRQWEREALESMAKEAEYDGALHMHWMQSELQAITDRSRHVGDGCWRTAERVAA